MNLVVVTAIAVALLALRYRRIGAALWAVVWLAAAYAFAKWAIVPPLPSSIVSLYMLVAVLSVAAYFTADDERPREIDRQLRAFVTEKRLRLPLVGVLALAPIGVGAKVYLALRATAPQPPAFGRTIHPAPPSTTTFRGRELALTSLANPYRALEQTDPTKFAEHVRSGRRVYHQNCVFCHGDDLAGKGLFAHGLDPLPTNFQDAGTIAQLQESFLFWRIAKGGPGLPEESGPWSSAMPAWEPLLTEAEVWDVILFLYDYTGQRPRAREVHE